jgi:predicted enzyme related to lactoylglutathione lyase
MLSPMNAVLFFEIQANEPQRAIDFYERVFGWSFRKAEQMPIDYWEIDNAGIRGGLLGRPVPVPEGPSGTNAFTCSMEVTDFDATAEVVLAAGGIIAMGKFALPGVCWQGYFQDTEGNTFGIFEPNESAA